MMLRRRLLRLLCIAALGLALLDSVADAAGCPDPSVPCHTCSCGPHIFPQGAAQIVPVPAPASYAAYKSLPYVLVLPESFFHPPCLAA